VIVCDDATPGDENEKVIAAFKDKIPNLKYLKNPTNLGVGRNVMRTMEEAQGEFYMYFSDGDEIPPRYVEASVRILLDYPEAVCATPYILIPPDSKYFPVSCMDNSWFRRILIYYLLYQMSDQWGMAAFGTVFGMRRTSITRESMREALWRWEALRNHTKIGMVDMRGIIDLCYGKFVPIMDKEIMYIMYGDEEKEYEYIGKHTDTNSFFQNQRDKLWTISDCLKTNWAHIKIVYDRGGWRCALPFGLLILVILLYAAGSSLYQQIRGRWRKILGKEEITQS
jgi:glycosyltransferase involved in cell wall biosynthesis